MNKVYYLSDKNGIITDGPYINEDKADMAAARYHSSKNIVVNSVDVEDNVFMLARIFAQKIDELETEINDLRTGVDSLEDWTSSHDYLPTQRYH